MDKSSLNLTFKPIYSRWRHGGWYVDNVRYPSGACGCVSRNYPDGKWRIVCDERNPQPTYPSRDAAAFAELELTKTKSEDSHEPGNQSQAEDSHPEQGCSIAKRTYNVNLYREMRLYYTNISATSHEDAARIAADQCSGRAEDVEDCQGENLSALVDVQGDTEFLNSKIIDFEPTILRANAAEMLKALESAESFIVGFEGDEAQEGVDELLASIRSALGKARRQA